MTAKFRIVRGYCPKGAVGAVMSAIAALSVRGSCDTLGALAMDQLSRRKNSVSSQKTKVQ
jgi:hypothetical protein